MNKGKVKVIGAGPAGLAAALQLAKKGIDVEVFESEDTVGGISKTINYKGYYFDLGGHRFFTKFDEVNRLWSEILGDDFIKTPRLSRIYYNNKFFDYPLKPLNALSNIGAADTISVILSYLKAKISPIEDEKTLEDWVTNRFGYRLYTMFFKTYTEKVWGIPCSSIGADWAAQRIKGLSLYSAVCNALFKPKSTNIKTLIEEFMYPKYGPGMMYEKMAQKIISVGGKVNLGCKVVGLHRDGYNIKSITYTDKNGVERTVTADHVISSMPITELVQIINPHLNRSTVDSAQRLSYRSLINIDIIIRKEQCFPDNWIYVHSPNVKLGRVQNFKNWSPYMVADSAKTSLGLEYFCTEGDEFWSLPDQEMIRNAVDEVEKVGLAEKKLVEDGFVVRVPKAYPVYFTGYKDYLKNIKEELGRFTNLQPVGRYGTYRYNNMDHSIMTGLYAAENILNNEKNDIWSINTEPEYHEIKKEVPEKRFGIPLPEKG